MFCHSALLAIELRFRMAKFRCDTVRLPCTLGTRIAAFRCHTNGSVKLPLFRHFQDRFLTTNREKWGKKTGLCFARCVFLTFRGPLASHDPNLYPNRNRSRDTMPLIAGVLRGNTIRGNTTRNSERKMALWEGLWEGLWKTLKTSKNLWKPLKTSENLWNPPSQRSSQRPSRRQISLSEPLSPVAPNRVAPWNSYELSSSSPQTFLNIWQPIENQLHNTLHWGWWCPNLLLKIAHEVLTPRYTTPCHWKGGFTALRASWVLSL